MENLNPRTIASLSLACKFWGLARRQSKREAAAAYYEKAYAIVRQEMGELNSSTLELRKEMTRNLAQRVVNTL